MELTKWNKIQRLILGESASLFEGNLFVNSTLAISIILIFSTGFNLFLELKNSIVFLTVIGSVLYFSLFLYGRFINRGIQFYLIASIFTLIFSDIIWFLNYGSSGPMMSVFIVFYAFLILVFDKKYFIISPLSYI